jgi:hypothetical protein
MVEFPLVARQSARVLRRQLDFYPRCPDLPTLILRHEPGQLILADMWETNTFEASFHARLNVASAAVPGQKQR